MKIFKSAIFINLVAILFFACKNPFFEEAARFYEVTFETNGGTEIESVTTNKIQTEPKTTKANCDFLGWYEKSDFSEVAVSFPYEPKKATVLYAKWNQKYTVNFVTNCDMTLESVVVSVLSEPSSIIKTDCTFAGWYTNSSFAGEKVSFPLALKNDTTLYAKWIQNYTVTFNSNGGEEVESVKTGTLTYLPEPVKENYEFAGWFASASLSRNAVTVPFTVEKDTTLYAKWLPTYLVSFETDGGSEIASFRARSVESVTNPEKSGFSFIAWYTDSSLSKKAEFPLTLTTDITFYAEYKENFTVTFESNGGTAVSDVNSYVVENCPESTKENCTFAGWYTNAEFTEESKVLFPFYPNENTTLYAKWVKEMYKITYDANGATGGTVPESVYVEKGSSATVSSNTGALLKTGYAFTNWNTSKDGTSGQSYSAGTKITPTANITLYAQWGKDYAAMIDVEGGTFLMGNPDSTSRPTITLSSFRIAQYELTYELWKEVYTWATTEKEYVLETAKKGYATNDQYKSFVPSTNISWNDACVWLNAYSEYKGLEPVYYRGSSVWRDYSSTSGTFSWDKTKNGYRLPTECEWEYAANGGKYLSYTTYSGSNNITDVAWYYCSEIRPVGMKKSNALNIYDMSGNSAEWCYDYYADWGTGELTNPVHESGTYRIVRGGDITKNYSYKNLCTVFYRCINHSTYSNAYYSTSSDYFNGVLGLRIAQNYTE